MANNHSVWKSALTTTKSLIRYLEGLSDAQQNLLATGKAKVVFELQLLNSSSKNQEDSSPLELISKLNTIASREEAESWLGAASLNKRQYQEALRSIDVPWDKADKLERLREKLIESTIGFRLRSRAIQGSNQPDSAQSDCLGRDSSSAGNHL